MARAGRATKLTPGVQRTFTEAIAHWRTNETAAALCGITSRSYRNWMARGRRGEEPYAAFAQAMERAEAMGEARCARLIDEASLTDWRPAAWWLERRHPEEWGRH
jgi:transposase